MIQTNINYLREKDFHGNLKKAVSYLINNYSQLKAQEVGTYEIDQDFFYMVQEYQSKDTTPWESHKKYIDIQVILSGEEIMDIAGIHTLKQVGEYDEAKDFIGHEGEVRISMEMGEGDLAIFFPEDVHQPGLKTSQGNSPVKKCLFKIVI
ncbi:MAG: YhcH/YjgK/YiaL family protein [Brevinema sp.]